MRTKEVQTLCTWSSLVLEKGLPMMHLAIPTVQFCVDPLHVDCQSPPGSTEVIAFSCKSESLLLILSMSIVNRQSAPPRSTEAIAFSCKSESWLWILSTLIVNLPPSLGSTVLIVSVLIVDGPWVDCRSTPLTDFDFLIFNIRMLEK